MERRVLRKNRRKQHAFASRYISNGGEAREIVTLNYFGSKQKRRFGHAASEGIRQFWMLGMVVEDRFSVETSVNRLAGPDRVHQFSPASLGSPTDDAPITQSTQPINESR